MKVFLNPKHRDALLDDPRVVNMALLVESLSWPQRVVAWLLWRTPLRRLLGDRFVNPFAQVVVTLDPSRAQRGKPELDSGDEPAKDKAQ